jgi:hypothetical protein
LNVKPQYAPNFPVVQIVAEQPGLKTAPAMLHTLGLVADPRLPSYPLPSGNNSKPRRFPDYQRFLNGAPGRPQGRKDRSAADFTFCCAAIRWGWSIEQTAAQLMREPLSKAAERGERYARLEYQRRNRVPGVLPEKGQVQ